MELILEYQLMIYASIGIMSMTCDITEQMLELIKFKMIIFSQFNISMSSNISLIESSKSSPVEV